MCGSGLVDGSRVCATRNSTCVDVCGIEPKDNARVRAARLHLPRRIHHCRLFPQKHGVALRVNSAAALPLFNGNKRKPGVRS